MIIENGTVINGRYVIIEKIATGGMAVVYRAQDEKLDRFVTFKVLKEEFITDEQFIGRFNVEARAAASLSHPNIVNVYDVGIQGTIYYIVMEYIDGVTLKDLINKRAPFSNKEVLGVAIQIASALEHAHKNNIVHRDIKPQNILVTKSGGVKVTDFGIARASTASTVNTDSVGSVHYFSPEQARGGFVDAKSDIYSLGIVMYEMATAKLPFEGDSAVALAMMHINDQIPDMKQYNPDISDSVEKIILKATEKSTLSRYESAEQLNNDCKRALTNQSGDFVKKTSDFIDSPTVRITDDEIDIIRSRTKQEEEDYEPRVRQIDRKTQERNVIIAAVITALAIIALITSLGLLYINKRLNPEITVPNLVGMTFADGLLLAGELEVYLEKTEEYSDEVSKDYIIRQNLDEGDKIYKGETINVAVSLGTDKAEVPYVINKDIADAYEYFENLDLEIEKEYEFSDNIAKNVVISQSPEAGEMVAHGSAVTLYISLGKEITTVIVPSVEALSEAEARNLIQSSELIIGTTTNAESSTVPKGNVITQGIKAGSRVERNSIVRLVISSGPPQTAATPTPTRKVNSVNLHIDPSLPEGKDTVNVRIIKVTSSHAAEEVYNKDHSTSDFPLDLPVTGDSMVEFQMEIDGAMYGTKTVDFSEVSAG